MPDQSPRTNLGPLTTTFTPPPACTINVAGCATCAVAYQGQECLTSIGAADATTCWPPTSAGASSVSPPFLGRGFYSPGLICPSGYTSACSATAGGSSAWPVEYPLNYGETAVGCCPTYVVHLASAPSMKRLYRAARSQTTNPLVPFLEASLALVSQLPSSRRRAIQPRHQLPFLLSPATVLPVTG